MDSPAVFSLGALVAWLKLYVFDLSGSFPSTDESLSAENNGYSDGIKWKKKVVFTEVSK